MLFRSCSDFETRRIYKMTPDGEVLDDFPSPAVYPTGLTWDGQHLWLADANDAIIRLDQNCHADRILPSPGPNPEGIAWDGQRFYVADSSKDKLYSIDTEGGIIDAAEYPDTDFDIRLAGLVFHDNRLWFIDRFQHGLYVYDPVVQRYSGGMNLPGMDCRGIAHDGSHVWFSDIAQGMLYRVTVNFTPGEIILGDGVYSGPQNRGLTIDGRAITIRSENGPEHCVIDCGNADRGIQFRYSDERMSVVDGVTIRNGNSLDLKRVGGGAIRAYHSTIRVKDCTFTSTNGTTGVVLFKICSGEIDGCLFSGNEAEGAVSVDYGLGQSLSVSNTVFRNNHNSAIVLPGAEHVTVKQCQFIGNSGDEGGAIDAVNVTDLSVFSSRFVLNEATWGGAIFSTAGTYARIFDSSFIRNTGESRGGAICSYDRIHLGNCLFSRNKTFREGGGVFIRGTGSLKMCTLENNMSDRTAGGLYIDDDSSVSIDSSIVYFNFPDQVTNFGTLELLSSDVQDAVTGVNTIDADPMFDFGILGDSCLSDGSPCIDAGQGMAHDICIPVTDGTVCLDQLTTRQDSVPDSGILDMGYHYTPYRNDPDFRIRIDLPHHFFAPGDPCDVAVDIFNPSGQTVPGTPVFVWLEMGGVLYCAPSFGTFDYYSINLVPGETRLQVLAPFIWPEGISSVIGVHWYAALTDPEMTRIVGGMDLFPMGW